ncbi:MAG: endoflagellar protein [candidate division Zixibacteria bacterium HGW-Zixibacteria-1]|nr:MAG: endoflagellar protein [candidate division Zixibacteria bacterium HGW-Zixibacteria-1]
MIRLTKLNDQEIVINDDLIEFIESTPDTIISLIDGKKIMVRETPDEIIKRVAAFRKMSSNIEWKAGRGEKQE